MLDSNSSSEDLTTSPPPPESSAPSYSVGRTSSMRTYLLFLPKNPDMLPPPLATAPALGSPWMGSAPDKPTTARARALGTATWRGEARARGKDGGCSSRAWGWPPRPLAASRCASLRFHWWCSSQASPCWGHVPAGRNRLKAAPSTNRSNGL
jgi:hypothetical protein